MCMRCIPSGLSTAERLQTEMAVDSGKILDFDSFATPQAGAPFDARFAGAIGQTFRELPGAPRDPFSFIGSQADVDNVEVLDLTSTDENARAKRLVLAPGTY